MNTNRRLLTIILALLGAFLFWNTSGAFDRSLKTDEMSAVQALIAEQTGMFISLQ